VGSGGGLLHHTDALVPYADNFMGSGACALCVGPHPATPVVSRRQPGRRGAPGLDGRSGRMPVQDADVGFPGVRFVVLVDVTEALGGRLPQSDQTLRTEVPAHS
jgi:hypothetical protein